ncbi:hypothetical protein [Glaciihabitans sp. dw_435]|uniref:hypothetical protein n=1 Tax=Glaciihabitans sp. dw_435 TaxID=2720081 RepID=UPI001BD5357D|nr:hypothetical protein [Glaciihabitans sp. dw_435]
MIHPKNSLLRTAIAIFFLTTLPVFAVLYWYTAPLGIWGWLLGFHLLLAVLCVLVSLRQTRVFSGVRDGALSGNGIFSPTVTVPLADVRRVVLVSTYHSYPSETSRQLVVMGKNGRALFRMRGQFWHTTDFDRFAHELGVEVVEESTIMHDVEFFRDYPGSAYWFDNRPGLRIMVVIVVVAIALAAAAGIVALFRIPVG